MRIGEAIRLDQSDVDWDQSLAIVRASKFGKSRALPLQTSTMEALADYAHRRDRLLPWPKTTSFFVSITGKRLYYGDVQLTFETLVSGSGIGASSPIRPRIHDLRHSFAVRTMANWYRTGENVQLRLAWLATYLGHRDPRFTYWYLSASPSYSLWLRAASRFLKRLNHERARRDAAILLHRTLASSAPGESAHRGRLP